MPSIYTSRLWKGQQLVFTNSFGFVSKLGTPEVSCSCKTFQRDAYCSHTTVEQVGIRNLAPAKNWSALVKEFRRQKFLRENQRLPKALDKLGALLSQGMDVKEAVQSLAKLRGIETPDTTVDDYVMDDKHWHQFSLAQKRGANCLLTGPTQSGKSTFVHVWAKAAKRPLFHFNVGGWFDPNSQLVGNIHFSPDRGTTFTESAFVKAVKTPDAVILLDELTRAEACVQNALLNCLDGFRQLRLDAHPETPTIHFAHGVTFVATANQGVSYRGTRPLDLAVLERFPHVLEFRYMDKDEEFAYLSKKFPSVDIVGLSKLVEFAEAYRELFYKGETKFPVTLPRMVEAVAYMTHFKATSKEAILALFLPTAKAMNEEHSLLTTVSVVS